MAAGTQNIYREQILSPGFNYRYVPTSATIAVYDDFKSAPRIIEIQPAATSRFIENLASEVYTQAQEKGSRIPYTVIREVAENFIHAQFLGVVVSIFDQGNTIRFTDQGPGIPAKDKAQLPGYTTALPDMKAYIRGVGSGLPIVREYLDSSHGTIQIEDNLVHGSVITISLASTRTIEAQRSQAPLTPPLSQRERDFLQYFLSEGVLGITDLRNLTGLANSSIHATLKKLEEAGLVENANVGKKRMLTDLGFNVASNASEAPE